MEVMEDWSDGSMGFSKPNTPMLQHPNAP